MILQVKAWAHPEQYSLSVARFDYKRSSRTRLLASRRNAPLAWGEGAKCRWTFLTLSLMGEVAPKGFDPEARVRVLRRSPRFFMRSSQTRLLAPCCRTPLASRPFTPR